MVFLNRRGYAPVLHCADCGWKSECPHCSAFRVFHKIDRTLRCHHCGFTERVPRACPACGNIDIEPMGRGTEQLEEQLGDLLADVRRPGSVSADCPEGEPLRIARIDADSTRLKGTLETQLAAVHAGEVDVLVGTQMIAKGHDFRRITLVAAVNPDGALFSSDFRAPERLFSLLMQAAGRSGRDAALGDSSEVWIQTFQPAHPLYVALKAHDYPAFAEQQLLERQQAGMPPFSAQALVRAEARTQEAAQAFLNLGRAAALEDMAQWPGWAPILEQVFVYPAVAALLAMPSVTLAFSVFCAMLEVICSTEALVSSTLAACSLEACDSDCDVALTSSAALASAWAPLLTSVTTWASFSIMFFMACNTWPVSSLEVASMRTVRSPSDRRLAVSTATANGLVTLTVRNQAISAPNAIATPARVNIKVWALP
jgi:hypothetical protein